MSNTLFYSSLLICVVSAAILTVLHFQMKLRLDAARLPVKWFMTIFDDFQMWRTYRNEATARRWPIWPYYAYRLLFLLFAISGVVIVLNAEKLFRLMNGR